MRTYKSRDKCVLVCLLCVLHVYVFSVERVVLGRQKAPNCC